MARTPKDQADESTATESVVDPRNDQDGAVAPDSPDSAAEQFSDPAASTDTPEPADGAPEVPPTPDYTQEAQQAAANVIQRDAPQTGMEVGNSAAKSVYAPMGADGQADLSKLQDEPVEGYGVQVVAEGAVIDQATYDRLNANS